MLPTPITAAEPFIAHAPMGSSADEIALLRLMKVIIFSIVFLQKFALHAGDSDIQIILPIMLGCVALAVFTGLLRIDPIRLLSFTIFAAFAIISQAYGSIAFSATSILLIFIMYPLLCLRGMMSLKGQLSVINYFQGCMIAIGIITLLLQIVQYTIGVRYWPNLDNIVPKELLYRGYNYFQPLYYGSIYYKPNAIFMLEVSFVQQLSALALLVEIAYSRRLLVLALFTTVVLLTFAGSGLLMLIFAAPVMLFVLPVRWSIFAVICGAALAFTMSWLGWFGIVMERVSEFSTVNTSGYFRFTLPILTFMSNLSDPEFLLKGNGAGSTLKGTAYLLLPFAKLMSEYGFMATITFYVFLCLSLFSHSPNRFAAYAVFLQYNIGGSTLLIPLNTALLFTLCTFAAVNEFELREHKLKYRGFRLF